MKKLTLLLLSVFALTAVAQVTTIPAIIQKGYTGEVTVIFNPNDGNGGMKDAKECYAHTGLITAASSGDGDWKNVVEEWRKNTAKTQLTKDGAKWKLVIPNIYEYYGCPETEEILKMAFVFTDGPDGEKEGKTEDWKDIFIELVDAGLNVKFENPSGNLLIEKGAKTNFKISASDKSTISLIINNKL